MLMNPILFNGSMHLSLIELEMYNTFLNDQFRFLSTHVHILLKVE